MRNQKQQQVRELDVMISRYPKLWKKNSEIGNRDKGQINKRSGTTRHHESLTHPHSLQAKVEAELERLRGTE